jgi:type VI secretion system Hcp family effector
MGRKQMRRIFRRGILLLFFAFLTTILSMAAFAQTQTFMLVPGIQGGSLDAKHTDWIDVASLRQSWETVSKKQNSACEVEVVKGLDIAGPRLWAAAITRQVFTDIQIDVVRTGAVEMKFYEVHLANATIKSIVTAGAITFAETVTISAPGMTLKYYPQKPDGSLGSPVTDTITCN